MKKFTAFLIAAFVLSTALPVFAGTPQMTAPTAILIDSETGRVLYEKNADTKMYPASTTKVMTCLLATEYKNPDELVTASPNVVNIERGSSQVYIEPGEVMPLRQLLYALMLESANDAAIDVAEFLGGSVENFASMMNEKAKSLGAVNTHFVNPNGLHDDNHYTTARDLALIAREGMKNPLFRELVSTYHYEIPATNKKEIRNYITNSNKLISPYGKNKYQYAIGIKTGYTTKSQHCLVGGAKKDNVELIAVVLGDEKDAMYPDTVALFEYGFANYKKLDLLKKDSIVTTVTVENGDRKLNLLSAEDYSVLGREDEINDLQKTKDIKYTQKTLKAPIKKGELLGTITYSLDGKEQKKISLIAEEDVQSTKLTDKLSDASNKVNAWQILLILVALFLAWRTFVTYRRLKRRKRGVYLSKKKRY
jgi:D-alanyl-D-alanine carboxypeptidase (penicillin-binding protein 5/6)